MCSHVALQTLCFSVGSELLSRPLSETGQGFNSCSPPKLFCCFSFFGELLNKMNFMLLCVRLKKETELLTRVHPVTAV